MDTNIVPGRPLPPPWKKIAARSGDQVWIVDARGNTVAVVHRDYADLVLRLVQVQSPRSGKLEVGKASPAGR